MCQCFCQAFGPRLGSLLQLLVRLFRPGDGLFRELQKFLIRLFTCVLGGFLFAAQRFPDLAGQLLRLLRAIFKSRLDLLSRCAQDCLPSQNRPCQDPNTIR